MPSPQIERKLAAIMFTDIAGYTALSAKDETKALKLLDTQKQILTPIVEEFNGTLHKEMGDGLLFTFPTVTDAVKCGIKIQKKTKEIDDLNLRIGIHEGEITLKDGDALGDDVNVASRIEAFATSGGIAISSKVQQNISSLPEFETSYVGKPELKGVSQEVKVYCITSHGLPKTDEIVEPIIEESKSNFNIFAITGGILTAIGIAFWIAIGVFDVSFGSKAEVPSVGILMMENRGDVEDEFWTSSITEDLIVKVASAGLIRVAPMKEILEVDIKKSFEEIAKKLRVKYLLTSSLHKKEDGFDLRCQLLEAESGNSKYANKWSESIDKAPTIVGNLAENILRTLKVSTKQDIARAPTTNAEAYEYYLKAKFNFDRYLKLLRTEDIISARGLLEKANELDDNLLVAQILLGRTYYFQRKLPTETIIENNTKSRNIFEQVLRKAKKSGDKFWIGRSLRNIGNTFYYSDKKTAHNYYKRSLQINEELGDKIGMSWSLSNIGNVLLSYRDYDHALEYYKRSLSIREELGDKWDIMDLLMNLGNTYHKKRDFDNGLDYYKQALTLAEQIDDKNNMRSLLTNIAGVYSSTGRYDMAIDYYKLALDITKEIDHQFFAGIISRLIGYTYLRKGELDRALDYAQLSLNFQKEISDTLGTGFAFILFGEIFERKMDYYKAKEYFTKSLSIIKRLDPYSKERITETTIFLFHTFKYLGKQYDVNKIHTLIKETEDIGFEINLRLYKLLEDTSYLETAYNQIQEKADNLEPDIAVKFLSYPIPKAIVEEWEKIK